MDITVVVDPVQPHLGGNIEGGDPRTFSIGVWEVLIERTKPRSVLDVGCGEGHALDWFRKKGLFTFGVDGLQRNIEKVHHHALVVDLTRGPLRLPRGWDRIDLCWCCELVEHVPEEYCGNILDTFKLAEYVAMTAAPPGQTGHHHVNCQPESYWIDKMTRAGFIYIPGLTHDCRYAAGDTYFKTSGLMFRNIERK